MTTATMERSAMSAKADENYRRLIVDRARGEKVPDDLLQQAAAWAGRSAVHVEADIATVQKRDAAAAQLAEADTMDDRIASQQAEVDQAEEEYKAWQAEREAEAQRRFAAIRSQKRAVMDLGSKQRQMRTEARELLNATADRELLARERAMLERNKEAAADIVSRVRGPKEQLKARERFQANSNAEELRSAKLEPENFALAE